MSISRHTAYNLLGAVIPLAIGLVTIPLYLNLVGVERYGLLTLCWVLLGYLGFLDLGLGPAVSQRIAAGRGAPARDLVWTAVWISLAMGVAAAGLLRFASEAYLVSLPRLPGAFESELASATPLLGLMAPIVLVSSVLSGSLQGRERFLEMNLVTSLGSSLMSLLPLLAAFVWEPTLPALILGALVARFVSLTALFIYAGRCLPLRRPRPPSKQHVRPLLAFGGWITLSAVAAPLLMTMDRLIIGTFFGAAAVAIYSIPHGVLNRLAILPVSLSSALFPRFAATDGVERRRLAAIGVPAVAVIMTPLLLGLILVARPLFDLWIGPGLASHAVPLVYLLSIGVWASCISHIPKVLLEGSGRPDLVSKLLFAEIVPYLSILAAAMWSFGVGGAAAAWSLRAVVECLLLCRFAGFASAALRFLALPALAVAGAAAIALNSNAPLALGLLILLFALALLWSALHLPEALRSRLGRVGNWLPPARAGMPV